MAENYRADQPAIALKLNWEALDADKSHEHKCSASSQLRQFPDQKMPPVCPSCRSRRIQSNVFDPCILWSNTYEMGNLHESLILQFGNSCIALEPPYTLKTAPALPSAESSTNEWESSLVSAWEALREDAVVAATLQRTWKYKYGLAFTDCFRQKSTAIVNRRLDINNNHGSYRTVFWTSTGSFY
jgi:hypothetical protein